MRGGTQGLALSYAAVRSTLRTREISERKQVGDTAEMVNQEGEAYDNEADQL